jgi:hypothetical protein
MAKRRSSKHVSYLKDYVELHGFYVLTMLRWVMHLLYCDETNLEPRDYDFFIYGGIAISCDQAKRLHDRVKDIREEHLIPPDFILKFKPKPTSLTHQEFNEVKQHIIEASVAENVNVFLSIILHNLATSPDEARRKEINRVLYNFNGFLNDKDDYGLVLVDRFTDSQIDAHLREKFSIGLRGLPYTDPMPMDKIIGYHYSAIGQSHFSSIVDIILGSFRYAINVHSRNQKEHSNTAQHLLSILKPIIPVNTSTGMIEERYLFFSPKYIRSDNYRNQYRLLKSFLKDNKIQAAQVIQ